MSLDKSDLKKRLAELNRMVAEETRAREARREEKRQRRLERRQRWHAVADDPGTAPPPEPSGEAPPGDPDDRAVLSACAVEFPGTSGTPPAPLERLIPGREIDCMDGGRYWCIERRLEDLIPNGGSLGDCYCETFLQKGARAHAALPDELLPLIDCDPGKILYLDLETTGFIGVPLFLVGVLEAAEGGLLVRQHFARNYAEERHLLAEIASHLESRDCLVTYNGRTYDVPFLRDRGIANGVPLALHNPHLDLLYTMRRTFRGKLPDCRLTTVERHLCRRVRSGDVPGEQIPGVYHEYVRSGDARRIRDVLWHNALDLITLAEVVLHLVRGERNW